LERCEVSLPTTKPFVLRVLFVLVALGLSVVACQGPEAFYRAGDGEGGSFGSGGTGLVGSGGVTGTGGNVTGTGGKATGGVTGTGGTPATGGVTGTGGRATGGVTGTGGTPATGGMTGTGGRATGGVTGTGGTPATGGTTGTGGIIGTGGIAGTGGVIGTGGAAGASGAAGATGTGPCAGLCSGPTTVAPKTNSGGLGTGVTCQEVAGGTITSLVCGNFVAPRTFSVNGTAEDCATGGTFTLPATKNGGFCMQAGAGNQSYAYFVTF
jgi:hypothetical protein